MTAILHIPSSSYLQSSVAREVGAAALASLKKTFPGATVVERDLVKNPVPHIGPEFESRYTNPDAGRLALSRELIGEIMASDVLLIEDYQETYLRTILGFIGITDIESIAIEGVALGGEVHFKALEAGKSRAASIGAKAA